MIGFYVLPIVLLLIVSIAAANSAPAGDFDAAVFGTPYLIASEGAAPAYSPQLTDGNPKTFINVPADGTVQLEWRQPREIYAVRLAFHGPAPKVGDVKLEYYYHIWPDTGSGGWMRVDDPFNGDFVAAAIENTANDLNEIQLRMKALDKSENPKINKTGAEYRCTYKVRVIFKTAAKLSGIQCVTDSIWKTAEVKVDLLGQKWDGKVEARNARIDSVSPVDGSTAIVNIRYADNPKRLSADRGYVIVRRGGKGTDFSFFIDDVVDEGGVYVRDVNAFISDAAKNLSYSAWSKPADAWDATIMEKVAVMPEQTFARAMKEMPMKDPREAHLGLPILRQEISVDSRGQVFVDGHALRSPGPDKDRSTRPMREKSAMLRSYDLSTAENGIEPLRPKNVKRSLQSGYLPVINSKWKDGDVAYGHSVFATALDSSTLKKSLAFPETPAKPMGEKGRAADLGSGVKGDEPIATLSRIEIKNTGKTERAAYLWIRPNPMVAMSVDNIGMLLLSEPTRPSAGKNLTATWGQIDINKRGELSYVKDYTAKDEDSKDLPDAIRYTVRLAPGESHAIYLKVPYIEQLTTAEVAQLKALDWEKSYKETIGLWKKRLAGAIDDYNVPDTALVNLYRANLWHALVTTDRDVPTGLYEHGAATFGYNIYVNETVMVGRDLEMRGEHEEARRLFEPFLSCQGMKPLPGNFKGQDGLIFAAAPPEFDNHYTAQGYNMHHGFGMWAAAEHYFWTRDKKYLEAIAPNLIAASDWIVRERKATMVMNPDGAKPLEYGLAPAGDLEDVAEYLYWYPTNAYYYLGMKSSADALAEIGHPEAARIAADAEAYRKDIMASMRESVAQSPVVKLLDGTYVPCVPPRTDVLTTCKEGWIREGLYSTLHLVDCGLISCDDDWATWILHDLEDRIFMSAESGYGFPNPKEVFFTLGGFNLQPNLLDNSIAYLKRGQIPNFIRAFYNIYASSVYPDMVCFAEWVPKPGEGGGPLYKTPDESKFIQWMRQMLFLEMGDSLYIGRGVPRLWMADGKTVEMKNAPTYFGPADMKITSSAASGKITAEVSLPTRNKAKTVFVSLRHPDGKKIKSVKVNGKAWDKFDAKTDEVEIPGDAGKVTIVAAY